LRSLFALLEIEALDIRLESCANHLFRETIILQLIVVHHTFSLTTLGLHLLTLFQTLLEVSRHPSVVFRGVFQPRLFKERERETEQLKQVQDPSMR
jgi:hypothetical protein